MDDVMFYEVFEEERQALERFLPTDWRVAFSSGPIEATEKPPAALISVRTQSVIPAGWATQLRGILTRSAGYDHLTAYLRRTGSRVPCGYLPEYCSRAVAEQAVLLLLTLWRRLPRQCRQFRTFDRDGLTGSECAGKRVLVVGVGRIGLAVAQLAAAMGMQVRGVDIEQRYDAVVYTSLEDGLAWAEAVVCAASLTDSSRGMLDGAALRGVAPGTLLVNVSRGEITPTEDLVRLVSGGLLGGLALDVFDDEPALAGALRSGQPAGHPGAGALLEMTETHNVICTPHNAFNTREALERKARSSVEALKVFRTKGEFPCSVLPTGLGT